MIYYYLSSFVEQVVA